MNSIVTRKREYQKPQLNLVAVDYSISMQITSTPIGDPTVMKKEPSSSKDKGSSPFGGSRPNYK